MVNAVSKNVFLRNTNGLEDYIAGDEYKIIREKLQERRFTVGDTGVTYRVINHWEEKGLIPEGFRQTDKGWRKFSFVEMVWFEVLDQFRDFGFSLEDLKDIKDAVLDWNEKTKSYPLFEFYVVKAFLSEDDPNILHFSDGNSAIGTLADIEVNKIFFGSRSVAQVSLKAILQNLGFSVTKQGLLMNISDPEVDLISAVRDEDVSKVVIKNKKGKIHEIETSEMIAENPNLRSITKEIEDSDTFADVIMKFSGGKAQSVEVKKKKRM
jgi:DNA-binding transcriptional MerR regulator